MLRQSMHLKVGVLVGILVTTLLILQVSRQSSPTSIPVNRRRMLEDRDGILENRDGNMVDLAQLINSHSSLFAKWSDSRQDAEMFMSMLSKWILTPPGGRPPIDKMTHKSNVDCTRKRYDGALTGKLLDTPRLVVDFVMFGYDVDKLEIRFHETYDLVDVFVILETPCTFLRYQKPRLLPTLWKDARFTPFLDKIVQVHIDIEEVPQSVNVDDWFRSRFVSRFFALNPSTNPLVDKVFSALNFHGNSTLNSSYPIGIQNDADEIVSYSALAHVKHCELKPEIRGLQFPAYAFKKNFHWVQETYDMQCLSGQTFLSNSSKILQSFLWRPAPFTWPLFMMRNAGDLLRVYFNLPDTYCTQNMGLGAAIHMSSGAEPAEVWMKRIGTLDGIGLRLQPAFLKAAAAGVVTPEHIFFETMYPSCLSGNVNYKHFHIGSMGSDVAAKVFSHLPLLVRKHPERYPFLLPGRPVNAKRFKLIEQASQVEWRTNMCNLPSAEALLYSTSLTS